MQYSRKGSAKIGSLFRGSVKQAVAKPFRQHLPTKKSKNRKQYVAVCNSNVAVCNAVPFYPTSTHTGRQGPSSQRLPRSSGPFQPPPTQRTAETC